MKGKGKILVNALIVAVCLALIVPAYFFWRNNEITRANHLRSKAKDEYFDREFLLAYNSYHELLDSMKVQDDAASINYANSAFMSSALLKGGLYGSSRSNVTKDVDEKNDQGTDSLFSFSQSEYSRLTTIDNPKIASLAYNQLGYSTLRVKDSADGETTDSTLNVALEHFKNSLRRNPENDSARYNYELIKRLAAFPATIMNQTQLLVDQKRYREAAEILENGMKVSASLKKKQQDYLNRLKQIVKIDSLYTRTR